MHKPEILAPAGNAENLRAAVYAGADAVYLGLDEFNARQKADNFTADVLESTVGFCHLYGVKVYLTLNTSVKEEELERVYAITDRAIKCKVDAFIVTDPAVIAYVISKGGTAHFSTQTGIANYADALEAKRLGATRIVLARECGLEDIKLIKEKTGLETEYFVQGALCVAFSGKCLMSGMLNGASGNRGRCRQLCRLKYTDAKGNTAYNLSAADINMTDRIRELTEAGVDSFKIEGRLRSREYVYAAVSAYKKAAEGRSVSSSDADLLRLTFNRGDYCDGYFSGKDVISKEIQGNKGLRLGKITRNGNEIKFTSSVPLTSRDGFKLLSAGKEIWGGRLNFPSGPASGERTGFTDGGICGNNRRAYEYRAELKEGRTGDEIYLTYSEKLSDEVKNAVKKLPVYLSFSVKNGVAELTAACRGVSAVERLTLPQSDKPINLKKAEEQLSKLGETDFALQSLSVAGEGNFYASSAVLNGLRRNVTDKLKKEIIDTFESNRPESIINNRIKYNSYTVETSCGLICVELCAASQLSPEAVGGNIVVYYPDVFGVKAAEEFAAQSRKYGAKEIYLKLPVNLSGRDLALIKDVLKKVRFEGIFAQSPGAINLAKEAGLAVFAGWSLNIYNKRSLDSFDNLKYFVPSAELSLKEINNAFLGKKGAQDGRYSDSDGSRDNDKPGICERRETDVVSDVGENRLGLFVYAFGKIPLMNFAHCPVKVCYGGDCSSCSYGKPLYYTDEKGYKFDIVRKKVSECYFELLNSVSHDLSKKITHFNFNFYLNMVQLSKHEITDVISAYKNGKASALSKYTCGRLFKGVE